MHAEAACGSTNTIILPGVCVGFSTDGFSGSSSYERIDTVNINRTQYTTTDCTGTVDDVVVEANELEVSPAAAAAATCEAEDFSGLIFYFDGVQIEPTHSTLSCLSDGGDNDDEDSASGLTAASVSVSVSVLALAGFSLMASILA